MLNTFIVLQIIILTSKRVLDKFSLTNCISLLNQNLNKTAREIFFIDMILQF